MTKLGDAVEHNVANEHASYLSLNKAEQPYQSHLPLARIILLTLAHMRRCESIPPPSDRAPLRRWPRDRFLARVRSERERQGRRGVLTELARGRGEHAMGVSSARVGDARRVPLPGAGEAVSETALDSRKFAAGAAAMLLRGLLSKEEGVVVRRKEERAV